MPVFETIKSAKSLARVFRYEDIPLYVHGAPGLGKSDMFKQLAEEEGIGLIDIRLATKLPEDLSGIPVPDLEKEVARWLKASFWPDPKRDGKEGIIVFDELSDTSKAVQSAAYQVILDRKIGEMTLPAGWWPVAAGNRREDRAAAGSISTALANRFAHITVIADPKAWIEWADQHDIDPMLCAFFRVRPGLLHSMDAGPEGDGEGNQKRKTLRGDLLAFPSPRSWARASKVIKYPEAQRFRLVAACVGEGAAGELEAFLKTIEIPDLDDVVAKPTTCFIPKEPASRYALASMLARGADLKNWAKIYQYVKRKEFGRDFQICCVLDATKRDQTLTQTPTYIDFANNNADISI